MTSILIFATIFTLGAIAGTTKFVYRLIMRGRTKAEALAAKAKATSEQAIKPAQSEYPRPQAVNH